MQKTLNAKKFLLQYHITSSLRTLTTNFHSPWNKKEEVETLVLDNDVDIVICSESHSQQGITNSEFLP